MIFNLFRVFLIIFLLSQLLFTQLKKGFIEQDVELMNSQDIAALGEWKLYMRYMWRKNIQISSRIYKIILAWF